MCNGPFVERAAGYTAQDGVQRVFTLCALQWPVSVARNTLGIASNTVNTVGAVRAARAGGNALASVLVIFADAAHGRGRTRATATALRIARLALFVKGSVGHGRTVG